MSKYLITPSLINSFFYYMKDEWKSPADSRADFLKTLSREKFEPNEAMQKGIDFEYLVEKTCDWESVNWVSLLSMKCQKLKSLNITNFSEANEFYTKNTQYFSCVKEIADVVKDGVWQSSCKKDLQVSGKNFILYGRCDVIKADTIYDIKFTSNYDVGKFNDSIQHLIYMYCLDLDKFAYLVSDGKSFWREDYFANDLENKIKSKISEFIQYLERDKEASNMFYSKWESKY